MPTFIFHVFKTNVDAVKTGNGQKYLKINCQNIFKNYNFSLPMKQK